MSKYITDTVLAVLTTTPVKVKEITALTGYRDKTVRDAVKELRLKGYKICSGTQGVWLWDGIDDSYAHTINRLTKHGWSEIRQARAMQGLPLEGQVQMEV